MCIRDSDHNVKGKACLSDCDPGDCGRFKFCLTVNTNDDYCFYIYALNSDEIMEICNNNQFLKFSSVIDVDPTNIVDNNLITCYGHENVIATETDGINFSSEATIDLRDDYLIEKLSCEQKKLLRRPMIS